jgi:acyl-CoA thioesterase-1
MRPFVLSLAIAASLAGAACRNASPSSRDGLREPQVAARSGQAAVADSSVKTESKPRIVFLGDSLTAGLGLAADQSYPALLQSKLDEKGYRYEVVNAGVSGDTSAGGLRRLDWSLEGDVKILVVALGANDGLRGLSPQDMRANLSAILDRAAQRGITVILAGMEAPPNYGVDYTRQFRDVYGELARTYKVRFLPFLLQGVGGTPALNQPDGIHPNARGAQLIADLVWSALEPVLARPTAVSP